MTRRLIGSIFLAALTAVFARPSGAQQSIIVGGVVVSSTTGQSLPYSTVSVSTGIQRFTAADGSFSVSLPPGQYRIRVRQLGYAALDTLIPVNPGADLRALTFALKPVAYRLAAVRTFANSCSSGTNSSDLGGLLDELIKNAERERLLRTEYPFIYDLERWVNLQRRTGSDDPKIDTVHFASTVVGGYSPGHLVHPMDTAFPRGPREMRVPTLVDLADPAFIANHCFRFRGMERVSDAAVYRIDFKPTGDVKGPDVEGSAFIDSATFLIKRAIFRLTKPEKLDPPAFGLEVTTTYHEIFKGLALFEKIHSVQPLVRSSLFRADEVQDQNLISVRFYGRTPGDVVLTDSSATVARRPAVDSSATLAGTVVDSGGRPLRGADVRLAGGSARAVSGDSGQFILKGLKPGKTDVLVRVLGYGPASFSTVLRAARTRRVRVILTPVTVQLSTVVVRDSISDPLLRETGFYDRKKSGWGTFITPQDIERRNPSRASDMLRTVSSVDVQLVGTAGTLPMSTRAVSGRCLMALFIDGVKTEIGTREGSSSRITPGGMMTTLEDVISGSELGAIEVYAGPSETPARFIGGENACGTVVIWTKGWLSQETEPDSTKHR